MMCFPQLQHIEPLILIISDGRVPDHQDTRNENQNEGHLGQRRPMIISFLINVLFRETFVYLILYDLNVNYKTLVSVILRARSSRIFSCDEDERDACS